jgi:hypothetical protein
MLLQEHRHQEIERAQELAAFSGYMAAIVARMLPQEAGPLPPFSDFYRPPAHRMSEPKPQTTSAEYKARYDSWQ